MSNGHLRVSPAFLKTVDSLLGRAFARVLPQPLRQSTLQPPDAILVIRPGGIGDAALLAPLITELARHYPAARIDILAERRNAGVFSLIPGINELFLYDRGTDLFKVLRKQYDLVIDSEQWHRLSAVVTRIAAAAVSIGYATNERSRLFTDTVPYAHDTYEAQSFLNLLLPLGIKATFDPTERFLTLPAAAPPGIAGFAAAIPAGPYVTLFPGASISERRWGTANFRSLARRFLDSGLFPVVVGGETERLAGDEIIADGGLSFAGRTTLTGSAYLISRAVLLVSGDSGILHIGTGLGTPTVALFGPGIAEKWGPRGSNHVVIDQRLDCAPCTRFGYTPHCSFQARCMTGISVDDVYLTATALLNKSLFSVNMPLRLPVKED